MQTKIQEKFFVSEKKVSELVMLNCLYYFSWAVSMLTKRLQILRSTKRDYSQLNCFQSGQ